MKKYRIMTDGEVFKVQKRVFLFFWKDEQRPEDLDNKDFGGLKTFTTLEQAQSYIKEQTLSKYQSIK